MMASVLAERRRWRFRSHEEFAPWCQNPMSRTKFVHRNNGREMRQFREPKSGHSKSDSLNHRSIPKLRPPSGLPQSESSRSLNPFPVPRTRTSPAASRWCVILGWLWSREADRAAAVRCSSPPSNSFRELRRFLNWEVAPPSPLNCRLMIRHCL